MIGLIGKKVGMTRLFGRDGKSIPVTAILAGPCHVVQIKSDEKEGYQAVQLGAFHRREKLVKKPQQGHFAKAGVEPKAKLAEFRVEDADVYHLGQELRVDIFQERDLVKVTGTSKGRGFAGGVKRWGFAGGPKSHGQSDRHRAPGSIGGASWPSRVWKGMKMAGRMGSEKVTIRNLEVIKVDLERNILLVKGAVPGARNGYLLVQRTTKLESVKPPSGVEEEAQPEKKTKKESAEVAVSQAAEPEAPSFPEEKVPEEPTSFEEKTAPEKAETPSEKPEEKAEPKKRIEEKPPEAPASPEKEAHQETAEEEGAPPEEESSGEEEEKADG